MWVCPECLANVVIVATLVLLGFRVEKENRVFKVHLDMPAFMVCRVTLEEGGLKVHGVPLDVKALGVQMEVLE